MNPSPSRHSVLGVLRQQTLPQELHPLLIGLGELGLSVHEVQQGVEGILAVETWLIAPASPRRRSQASDVEWY